MSITFYGYAEPYQSESGEVEFVDGPNVSNAHGAMIVEALGLEFDNGGSYPIDEFEAAVRLAQIAGPDDSGMATVQSGGPGTGGATMIDCGLRPGYFADRFADLLDLCSRLREKGIDRVVAA